MTDEKLLLSDVAEAQRRVDSAWDDLQDLESDAAGWPGAEEIASLANDAASAVGELSEKLNSYREGSGG